MSENDTLEGFKTTELGILPENWKVESLKNLNLEKKVNLNPANFSDEIFEYYSIPAYQDSKNPTLDRGSAILSQKIILKNGAILFGKLNPRVEKVWKVQSNSHYRKIGSTEWIPIVPDNSIVDSDYLYYVEWSEYVMPIAKTLVTGSTPSRQRVDPTSFYKIKIPLPPLPEQHRIAAVLSAVQDAKEKTVAVIAAAKSLKKSLMRHLFTYGPVSIGAAESVPLKETEIGLVPERWGVLPISQVSEVIMGQSPPGRSYNTNDVGVPLINGPAEFGESFPRSTKWTVSPTKTCVREDILFCVRGNTTGRMNVADTEYCIGRGVAAIRGIDGLSETSYLFYFLKKEAGTILKIATAGGSTFPNITKSQLRNFSTPTPPLPIQQEIAHILSTVDKKIEAEENKKKALDELFKSLLHNLMTGKIRVNHLEVTL